MAEGTQDISATDDTATPQSGLDRIAGGIHRADKQTGKALRVVGNSARFVTNNIARTSGEVWLTLRESLNKFKDASSSPDDVSDHKLAA